VTEVPTATDIRPEERLAEVQAELKGYQTQHDNGGLTKPEADKFVALREEERKLLAETTVEPVDVPVVGTRSEPEVRLDFPIPKGQRVADPERPREQRFGAVLGARCRDALGRASAADRELLAEIAAAENEYRSLTTGAVNLVQTLGVNVYGGFFGEVVRAKSRVLQAGTTQVLLTENATRVPIVSGDVTLGWRNEGAAVAETDATITGATFVPQTLGGFSKVSVELIQDADVSLEGELESIMAGAVALEFDRASLLGSGTVPEPKGVFNWTGVTKTPLATDGRSPTWDDFVDLDARLAAKNFEAGQVIANPRTVASLAKIKASTAGTYLEPPSEIADILPILDTTKVSTTQTQGANTDCSSAFLGEWRFLALGVRLVPQVMVLRERFIDNGFLGLLVLARADVQVVRAGAFEVITGIRP
jgi:HK97 family phage major capsid protein